MVTEPKLTRRVLGLFAVLALLVSACGSDSEEGSGGGGEDICATDASSAPGSDIAPAESLSDLDLSAVSVTVASKDFTENQIVAEMMAQAIEAGGGSVERQINLGGTEVNRQALTSGNIGLYPEYNGTGWTVHLGCEEPSSDPDELYNVTATADLEANDIHWLGTSEFNNTYGFATGPALTEENGGPFDLQGMADYIAENPDATVCMETEFPDRPDGLVLYEEATESEIPGNQQNILDTGIIYNETAEGNCDFGEVFTTDGRIAALDMSVVDDGGAFIIYNVSMTMADDVYSQAPDDLTAASAAILNDLDNDTMAELNRRVDVDGESLGEVAESYLTDAGLI